MKIEFAPTNAIDFLQKFAEQLDAEVKENTFLLPEHIGNGSGRLIKIEDDLSFFVYDFQVNTTLKARKKAVKKSKYYPVICWFSYDKIEQETDGEKKIVSKDSPYGIFLPSPNIESNYTIPAKSRFIVLTITFTPDWLKKNLSNKSNSNLLKLIESNKPFFVYEEISFNMSQYLEKIQKLKLREIVSLIHLRSYVLTFLALFISAVENRTNTAIASRINHHDVEKLFNVRHILTSEYSTHHEIKTLAANAAMSERKLQKLFKDVFGITIYQYALKVKIEEAKRMIETRQYTISEVGYNIGYSNLSHFTTAFKKHVGINPKQYLLNLK